jgi:cysteine desulfurase/selenocysteine lyase
VRSQFALLEPGERVVYLDSAATTLKPRPVIEAIAHAHAYELNSVRRGAHQWAQRATEAYEGARARVAGFVGARAQELVFVRGSTDALNLVAECWARPRLGPGDEVLVTELDHHSNFLPWQRVARETGARFEVAAVRQTGHFDLDLFASLLRPATKVVACPHVSNVLGHELPVAEIRKLVRSRAPHAALVVDGAQAAAHMAVNVVALDCDFYAFSGHKVYGPAGIGALFGRGEHLECMPPYQVGGGMVSRVEREHARFVEPPQRFEAGTPDVVGALGLAAALDYLGALDRRALREHENALITTAERRLLELPGVRVLGPASGSLLSFVVAGVHPHDLASALDACGVAVRAGHHCAQPLMARLGVPGTVRVSVAAYSTLADVEALIDAVRHACELFR